MAWKSASVKSSAVVTAFILSPVSKVKKEAAYQGCWLAGLRAAYQIWLIFGGR